MKKQRILHSALAALVSYAVFGSLEPILSLRLGDYNVSQSSVGLIFAVQPGFYALGSFVTAAIIPKRVEYRVTMFIGLLLLAVATALIGPFYDEMDLPIMMVGLALSGFSVGLNCLPNMPEMIAATAINFKDYEEELAHNRLSGLLNAGFSGGQFLGPVLGAFLYQISDFVVC